MRSVRRLRLRLHGGTREDAARADAATRAPRAATPPTAPTAAAPRAEAAQPARPVSDPVGDRRHAADGRPRPTTRAAAVPVGPRRLTFHGSGGTLFGIYVVNILLTIATFGLYRFWGRVKIRRFMLSQTGFEGDRFAYHGTGKELLVGFVKALLFVGLPVTALSVAARLSGDKTIHIVTQVFTSLLVFVFIPIAMVGARRYRLSRTSWRGIRFSFRGPVWEFVRVFVAGVDLEHADAHALLPVLPDATAGIHDLEFVLRPAAVPFRRTRTRSLRRVRRRPAAARADVRDLSVLVQREEGPLLLGAHLLRDGAFSLDDDGRPTDGPDARRTGACSSSRSV